MKFKFGIIKHRKDSYIFEISYAIKTRIITKDELEEITTAVRNYLKKEIDTEFNELNILQQPFILELADRHCSMLEELIDNPKGKFRISLPYNLSRSTGENHFLIYSHRNLEGFKEFWKDDSINFANLLKLLSEDLLELPYADEPWDYLYRFDKRAFHVNHGSAHGLRQCLLVEVLINYILSNHDNNSLLTRAVNNIHIEEIACLKLAMFLFRSGRTNELGWSSDPAYSPRSILIFTHIALELGFDKVLVNGISQGFDFEAELDIKEAFLDQTIEESIYKARLFQKLFHMVHCLELMRCFTNQTDLEEKICAELDEFLESRESKQKLLTKMTSVAAQFLEATGAPNACLTLQSKGNEGRGNSYLQIRTILELESFYSTLQKILLDRPAFSLCSSPEEVYTDRTLNETTNSPINMGLLL